MRGFGIGGDPQLQTKLSEAQLFLEHIKQHGGHSDECELWLRRAEHILREKIFLFFYSYSSYDQFWQSQHQMRHIFCRISPRTDLPALSADIRGCLTYITDTKMRKRCEADLDECDSSLRVVVGHYREEKNCIPLSLEQIRYTLEQLSRISGEERDSHWRKVNLLRLRLVVMAFLLGSLLLWLSFVVPRLFPDPDVDWQFILAILLFGALGGMVSALSTTEALEAPSSAYYIRRILVGLKPVIGAAGGLVLYLLQISGIVVIVTSLKNPTATYLTTAFLAGFSEKFFTSRIEKVVGAGRHKDKKLTDEESK